MNSRILIALSCSILISFASCKKTDCGNQAVAASFEDLNGLDGCKFVLELQNGARLEPVNLSDFSIEPKDGMKVWITYNSVPMGSICMVGETVELTCITKR
jgi:hypothetical protein